MLFKILVFSQNEQIAAVVLYEKLVIVRIAIDFFAILCYTELSNRREGERCKP